MKELFLKQIAYFLETDNTIAGILNAFNFTLNELADLSWIGLYLKVKDGLALSLYAGKPACLFIPDGKGVCGKAYESAKTIVVPDVNKFIGHIVCDNNAKSEMVIPIEKGVLDIDSTIYNCFNDELQDLFENYAKLIEKRIIGINLLI